MGQIIIEHYTERHRLQQKWEWDLASDDLWKRQQARFFAIWARYLIGWWPTVHLLSFVLKLLIATQCALQVNSTWFRPVIDRVDQASQPKVCQVRSIDWRSTSRSSWSSRSKFFKVKLIVLWSTIRLFYLLFTLLIIIIMVIMLNWCNAIIIWSSDVVTSCTCPVLNYDWNKIK